jgi:hypothetical protein
MAALPMSCPCSGVVDLNRLVEGVLKPLLTVAPSIGEQSKPMAQIEPHSGFRVAARLYERYSGQPDVTALASKVSKIY